MLLHRSDESKRYCHHRGEIQDSRSPFADSKVKPLFSSISIPLVFEIPVRSGKPCEAFISASSPVIVPTAGALATALTTSLDSSRRVTAVTFSMFEIPAANLIFVIAAKGTTVKPT